MDTYFDKVMEKLESGEELSKPKRDSLLDLSINMVLYVDSERISKVCAFAAPLLKVRNHCCCSSHLPAAVGGGGGVFCNHHHEHGLETHKPNAIVDNHPSLCL